MSVPTTNNKIQSTANGVTTAFPFPYLFFSAAHLVVIETDLDGVDVTKTLTTDYTVSGASNPSGGTITFGVAPANGHTITIYREVPYSQNTDYVPNDDFPAETHERVVDLLTMQTQQLKSESGRTLKFPVTEPDSSSSTLPGKVARAGKFLYFDPVTGEPSAADDTTGAAESAAAAALSASNASTSASDALTAKTDAETAKADAEAAKTAAELAAASLGGVSAFDVNQYAVAAGTNTYTATLDPVPISYVAGMEVALKIANANTGAATVNLNGLGAIAIQKNGAALVSGDIAAGQTILLRYDGSAFQLLNSSVGSGAVPVRQTVLSGPFDASVLPAFLPATSASLTLTTQNIAPGTPLILAAAGGFGASGAIDRIAKLVANVSWILPANSTVYLGFDVAADGTATPVATTLAPLYVNIPLSDYYSSDITATGYAISGGDTGSYPASQAFNNNASDTWASLQSGTGISGVAYIGQDFGATKRVRKITLNQGLGSTANCITSALLQYSDNGSSWTTVTTISPLAVDNSVQTFLIPDGGAHRYWRLMANANPSGGSASWQVREIEMMELSSAVNGQFVFSIPNMSGSVGDGSAAVASYRVFVGEAVTGASTVTSTVAYAYQGKFQTIFPSPAASTNTTYSHNIGMKPLHVRTFMICTIVEAGWAVGDEVDIQGASFASGYVVSGNPVSCIGNNTARYTQGDINPRLPSISSPGTYINSTRANWSVKSILQRGW